MVTGSDGPLLELGNREFDSLRLANIMGVFLKASPFQKRVPLEGPSNAL